MRLETGEIDATIIFFGDLWGESTEWNIAIGIGTIYIIFQLEW